MIWKEFFFFMDLDGEKTSGPKITIGGAAFKIIRPDCRFCHYSHICYGVKNKEEE